MSNCVLRQFRDDIDCFLRISILTTLEFSSSQLRENSYWMFASRSGLIVADIRAWMGDFHNIKNVAKYAAIPGQSFGSFRETSSVESNDVELIPGVEL
nr:probable RNA-dependent RNA polymerase 1 [Ipomoea trifida]